MASSRYVLEAKDSGQKYALAEEETVIGRDPTCQVVIDDDSVSRRHARVVQEDDTYFIEDLESRNGTFVNGEQVDGMVPLRANDRIEIGVNLFEFRSARIVPLEPAAEAGPAVVASIDATASGDTVYKVNAEGKLRAILQITKSLGKTLDRRALLAQMLDGLFQIFPQADRGLVLLRDGQRLVPAAVKDRRRRQEHVQYSKTIVSKAVAERKAILSHDVAQDSQIPAAASITRLNIHSVMCVPLFSQDGKVLGVVQMDIQDETRKFDAEDMEILTSVASQASVSVEHAQLHREMMKHARIQRELDFARDVQHSFLPGAMPELEGYSFWAFYQAARQVGGDFYDFLRLPNGQEAILVGDVAGKGIPAALMMVKMVGLCKLALLSRPDDVSEAMNAMNREIHDSGSERGFVTLVLSVIDPGSHEVTVAIAGHVPPMFRRAGGTIDDKVGYPTRGKPLGVERNERYQTDRTQLAPGDAVILCSDGISEAMNDADEPYSIERICEQLSGEKANGPEGIGQGLLEDVRQYVGQSEQRDDISLVVFQRDPEGK